MAQTQPVLTGPYLRCPDPFLGDKRGCGCPLTLAVLFKLTQTSEVVEEALKLLACLGKMTEKAPLRLTHDKFTVPWK